MKWFIYCGLAVFAAAETQNKRGTPPVASGGAESKDVSARRQRLRNKFSGLLPANPDEMVPVLIVLSDQPHEALIERAKAQFAEVTTAGEARHLAAVSRVVPNPVEVANAALGLERNRSAIRRAALTSIEVAIRPSQDRVEGLLRGLSASAIKRYSGLNMIRADVPAGRIRALAASPDVIEVARVSVRRGQLDQSVPAIRASSFWDEGYEGAGVSVAVLDSGIVQDHPAFQDADIQTKVFTSEVKRLAPLAEWCLDSAETDDSATDRHGHGTHVAGIIASRGSSFWRDYKGVAPGLGALYAVKISLKTCKGDAISVTSDLFDAFEWLVHNTAVTILNDSNGATDKDRETGDPVVADDDFAARVVDYYARQYDLTITVAAGNRDPDWKYSDGYSGPFPCPVASPAIAYNAIAVANWDISRHRISGGSCHGPTGDFRRKPDLAAPGTHSNAILDGIYSTNNDWRGITFDFVPMEGTSMAAPHVAGAAALIQNAGVYFPLAIKALLINTANNTNWEEDSGYGLINLFRAKAWFNVLTITVSGTAYFAGAPPADENISATLVWNRRSYPQVRSDEFLTDFSDLDLYLYDRNANSELSRSESAAQNVEQVFIPEASGNPAVIKVKRYAGSPEAFGLAVSKGAFTRVSGPSLAVAGCLAPAAVVSPGATVEVQCTLSNPGGLDLFDLHGYLEPANGADTAYAYGPANSRLSAGAARASYTFGVTLPQTPGSFSILPVFNAKAYGEGYIWWRFTQVNSGSANGLNILSLESNRSTVTPGNDARLTITLSGPAPASGIYAAISSDAGDINFPFAVRIPAGQRNATFQLEGNWDTVASPFATRITAALFSSSKSVDLRIVP